MGFFDRFSSDVKLTPAIALATSMSIYDVSWWRNLGWRVKLSCWQSMMQ